MRPYGIQRTERPCFWVTNQEFAKTNSKFKAACEAAGIEPTQRQASKWRRKVGLAYTTGRRALKTN